MSMKPHVVRSGAMILASVLALGRAMPAQGRTVTLEVQATDIRALDALPEGTARAWWLPVGLPSRDPGERVMGAWLELVVDAGADVDTTALGGAVTLEVFGLERVVSRTVTAADVRSGAMKRSVVVGSNRRLRVDVTEFVQQVLDDGATNRGLVVGAVTGARYGRFRLREVAPDTTARLTVYLGRREGPPRYRRR